MSHEKPSQSDDDPSPEDRPHDESLRASSRDLKAADPAQEETVSHSSATAGPGEGEPVEGGKNRLELSGSQSLREGIVEAFGELVTYMHRRIGEVEADPATAIHDCRKSTRRLRALAKLLRRQLGSAAYDRINGELRDAVRGTSGLRDARILIETLDGLPEDQRSRDGRSAVGAQLAAELERLEEAAEEPAALMKLGETLRGLPEYFRAVLPEVVPEAEIVAAVRRSYRSARRAARQTKGDRSAGAIHAWRKRVKELRYQSELLQPLWPPLAALRQELARLAKDLGDVTDLNVLAGHVHELKRQSPELGIGMLRKRVRRRARERLDDVHATHLHIFQRKPKRFAAEVLGP